MRRTLFLSAALLNKKYSMSNQNKNISDIKEWKFRFPPSYNELPIDKNPEYNIPMAVNNAVFSKVPVEPLIGKLHLVCGSREVITDILDLDIKALDTEDFVNFVSGQLLPDGAFSVCHRYGGYQFGFWADQLGDGRAHILGEYVNSKGESWQLQLKGSGETPFSRFGDGRAVLRSSLREMVASEACHYLGIPTTRAGALVVSDYHKVWRDKTGCGRTRQERAAVVLRLARAWYRLGSFEILYKRQEPKLLKHLADFIIKHHFDAIDENDDEKYVKWYAEVVHRNLDMVATWQGIGFTHGVLNTDNISVLGLTIDYGPYGFMEHYSEHYVPNTSDDMGRYAYNRQPEILMWNLTKFAEALTPILNEKEGEEIKKIQDNMKDYVDNKILQTFQRKLGLDDRKDGDEKLVGDLMSMMQDTSADFTCTFRQMAEVHISELDRCEVLETKWSLDKIRTAKGWGEWVRRYRDRLLLSGVNEDTRRSVMRRVNPVYVPRNWILQEAIADAESNDFNRVRLLMKIFEKPFEVNEEAEKLGYSSPPPNWAYGLKLSCSS